MKIAIIDTIGLTYDGNTLNHRGLGGSESAVILISKELAKIGFSVTVYNNCIGSDSTFGIFDNVRYIDHSQEHAFENSYDIVISSRSVFPFFAGSIYHRFIKNNTFKVLWMHDTFCKGDEHIEPMVVDGIIDEIFTLSDFHTAYVMTNDHGYKRMMEVLKHKNFMTRNGAVRYIDEVDTKQKDPNHFVYNASVTKGLNPLLYNIWPEVKRLIPSAHLTVIGGYYRFSEKSGPDQQERDLENFRQNQIYQDLNVSFTGVIPQFKIAEILANASFMIYPTEFPETFGISSLESLLYKTPLITNRFGALEETAIDLACYKVDYPSVKNSLFPHIDEISQTRKFIEAVVRAYNDRYLLQQKQNYCDVIRDIHGWDSIAKQWKQHFYLKLGKFLSADEYQEASRINDKVSRIFGRRFNNLEDRVRYRSYKNEQRIVVISPFFNGRDYLENCIESVAQQDYENYQHILIDDSSTDDSLEKAKEVLSKLPDVLKKKFLLLKTEYNRGALANHLHVISQSTKDNDIIMLLDGDDWLINNNSVFHLYNDLYHQGYEFVYGSCFSLADKIPLIAQDYPCEVRKNKTYRKHLFNWNMPYTHLRTFRKSLINNVDAALFKDNSGKWMKAGGDGALFYGVIEQANPNKIFANKEIIYNYNDINPLNDYKVNPLEQNSNASLILNRASK